MQIGHCVYGLPKLLVVQWLGLSMVRARDRDWIFSLPSCPHGLGADLAAARATQWAWHRKHVTTVTFTLMERRVVAQFYK